jgi:hypothetical protein
VELWHWLALAALVALALYAAVGFTWGSLLNALCAADGGEIKASAVLHGMLWPLSMFDLI